MDLVTPDQNDPFRPDVAGWAMLQGEIDSFFGKKRQ
jgi:hypothetical protein